MRNSSLRAARLAALVLAGLAACTSAPPPAPAPTPAPRPVAAIRTNYATGEDLLAAMRAKYEGKWYTTLTFTQKTSRLQPDGTWNVATWYEAMRVPGRLRIDFDPVSAGNGVLYARDTAFTFRNGQPVAPTPSINPLLLLGFDVYGNPPARTAALLRREGYDLARVRADSFEGRPMIVVGALRTDPATRKQIWIDAERLYFVRLLGPARDTTKVQDTRFVNYRREGDAWVSPRVEIYSDGKLIFYEDYTNIRANVLLDDAIFDPSKWKTAKHWNTP
jgi:hypothetical protein